MNIKQNLSVTVVEIPCQENMYYKYFIKNRGYVSYSAYKTDKGFQFFLESRNLKLNLVDEFYNEKSGTVKLFDIIGEIHENSFWHIEEIPVDAIPYKDLSNGKIVTCYYKHIENGSIIYRPNPNAKDVYKPLPIDEQIKYQEING